MANPRTQRYRVLVSTDLGGDPDDIQSLFRLIHHSDLLGIEGLTSCTGPGSMPSAELIREWVRRVDVDHLRDQGHPELMAEDAILVGVKQGAVTPGAPSSARVTEGSRWIVERANEPGPAGQGRPLWVLVWGSLTDVAQALHDDPSIADKIRIYYIGSSNTANDSDSRNYVFEHMADLWPQLWWIENGIMPRLSHDTFRGVYQGGDQEGEWSNLAYVHHNIRGRGTTHNGMFRERCGDAFPLAEWPDHTLKEGDSPSMLYLLAPILGNVGDVDDPTQESWGGQFRRAYPDEFPNYCCDLDADAEICQATISRWRLEFLSEWKERWAWYVARED